MTYPHQKPCFPLMILLATLILSSSALASRFDPVWSNPRPQGAGLNGLGVVDETTVYAVGFHGTVLESTNGGLDWTDLTDINMFSPSLEDIAQVAPGQLLAVGEAPGIFRSLDHGRTWTVVSNPSQSNRLMDIAVTNGVISIVGEGSEVLRSQDGGQTWSRQVLSPGYGQLREQFWLDSDHGYLVGGSTARRTTDGGDTWQAIPEIPDISWTFSEVSFPDAQHGIILGEFQTWTTVDGGANWNLSNTFPPAYQSSSVFYDPAHWLVSTDLEGAYILETTDGGQHWTTRYSQNTNGFTEMLQLPGGRLLAVDTCGDLLHSDDQGLTWQNAISGIGTEGRFSLGAVCRLPSGVVFAGSRYTAGLTEFRWLRSDNEGQSWYEPAAKPQLDEVQSIAFLDGAIGLAGGISDLPGNRLWRTGDTGEHWTAVELPGSPAGFSSVAEITFAGDDHVFLLAPGPNGRTVYRSTDQGVTFTESGLGIPSGASLASLFMLNATTGFVATGSISASQLWKTVDAGNTWQEIDQHGIYHGIQGMHWFDQQNALALVDLFPHGIFRTTNGGLNWSRTTDAINGQTIRFWDPEHGFALGNTRAVVTEDGGESWESFPLPFEGPYSDVSLYPGGFFLCGSQDCIVRMDYEGFLTPVDDGDTSTLPLQGRGLILHQLDASGGTPRFSFSTPRDGLASLQVFDVRGRHIRTLFSGQLSANQAVIRSWDGCDKGGAPAATGVYLVRFAEGSHQKAVKTILAR